MQPAETNVDIVVYVALSEEFMDIRKDLGHQFRHHELRDVALTCFIGSIESERLKKSFNVLVVPAGKMGNTKSASVVSAILNQFKPRDVVVIGIAGSLTSDLQPGDVFIPDRVNEYLANSATIGKEEWEFQTSGNQFITDLRLLNRFQVFWTVEESYYKRWRRTAVNRFRKVVGGHQIDTLQEAGLVMRSTPSLLVGDDRILASGPAVGKGKAFVDWLRTQVDRKASAIEMESAGVYDAALLRTPAPRAIAIRGISDFADERKEKLEAVAKGGFRKLAVKNALSLFIAAIQAGLFAESTDAQSEKIESSRAPPRESRVRSIFLIGGVTGDTKHSEFEMSRLQLACLALGKAIAIAGIRMIICSPFPDSADYFAITGFARTRLGGTIQFHSPKHDGVIEKRRALVEILGEDCPRLDVWEHPGPENNEAWPQAWLLCQLQALERADVLVAVGGKVSATANTILHLAEGRGLPVVPFSFLGGAAQRAFERCNWKRLHPSIDQEILQREDGVEKVVDLANQLLLDAVSFENQTFISPLTFFISRAKEDALVADELAKYLRQTGMTVLLGEESIVANKMAQATIEHSILSCNIFIALWNKNYALSPWCYDELDIALRRQRVGQLSIWLFNLDDSLIVPKAARKLKTIKASSVGQILDTVKRLLFR